MNNNQDQNQNQQNPCAAMCTQCIGRIPASSRILMGVVTVAVITGAIIGTGASQSCINVIVDSGFIQIYRIFISQFLDSNIIGGLLGLLTFWQTGPSIERLRGSLWLLHCFMLCSVLVNVVTLCVQSLLVYGAKWELATSMCSVGVWPTIMTMIAVENKIINVQQRPFMCCPFQVPTKFYPFIVLILFTLILGFVPFVSLLAGLLVGLAYCATDKLHLSTVRCQAWESLSVFSFLVSMSTFISSQQASGFAAAGGDVEAGGGGGGFGLGALLRGQGAADENNNQNNNNNNNRTFGSGTTGPRAMTISDLPPQDSSSDSSSSSTAAPSVFSKGTGHRLDESSSSTSSSFSLPFLSSSSSSSSSTASSSSSSSSVSASRSAAVERLARLAKANADAKPNAVSNNNNSNSNNSSSSSSSVNVNNTTTSNSKSFTIDNEEDEDDERASKVPRGKKQHGDYVELSNLDGDSASINHDDETQVANDDEIVISGPYTPWNPNAPPQK